MPQFQHLDAIDAEPGAQFDDLRNSGRWNVLRWERPTSANNYQPGLDHIHFEGGSKQRGCYSPQNNRPELVTLEWAMAANPTPYFTLEEYYALETASERRWEYRNGEVVCMSGGTKEHYTIEGNVYFRLRQAMEGPGCQVFTSDTAVWSPGHPSYSYPDVSVACDPQFRRHETVPLDMLLNPLLIVEVLSKTPQRYDHGEKFELYKAIPTFREYLLIEQDERLITHWQWVGGVWTDRPVTEGTLRLQSIGCEIVMADVYEGV